MPKSLQTICGCESLMRFDCEIAFSCGVLIVRELCVHPVKVLVGSQPFEEQSARVAHQKRGQQIRHATFTEESLVDACPAIEEQREEGAETGDGDQHGCGGVSAVD